MRQRHPESLLDQGGPDSASPDERRAFDAHVRACASCALEVSALHDFAAEGEPHTEDDARLARLVDKTMLHLESEPERRLSSTVHRIARRRLSWSNVVLVAAALLVVCAAVARVAVPASTSGSVFVPPPPPLVDIVDSVQPSVPSEPLPPPAPELPSPPVLSTEPTASAGPSLPRTSMRVTPPAAELFARANDARKRGRDAEAVQLYRKLEHTYPGSPEATQARLGLGRLLLDRRNDAAGALREFEGYISSSGPLRQEALVGRALALERLGRVTEARAAWQAVLAENPDSIHATRARERLHRLR